MIESQNDTKISESNVTDLNLAFVQKKKFRINGGPILELNVSDLNIIKRLSVAYDKLQGLEEETQKLLGGAGEEDADLDKIADVLEKIDKEMREQIDYIFDTNASEICAPSGNMFDPVEGQLRYEHIIEVLSNLYTTGLNDEFKKMKNKTAKHTSKYTKSTKNTKNR